MEHLLYTMHNAGLTVVIRSPRWSYNSSNEWYVEAEAKSNELGIELKVTAAGENLGVAVEEVYNKWLNATGRGIPDLSLRAIAHDDSF